MPEHEREIQKMTHRPFSARIGGKTYEYGRLDPAAYSIGLVATIAEGMNNPEMLVSAEAGAGMIFRSTMSIFRDKLYLKTVADFVDVFTSTDDEERWLRVFNRLMGNMSSQALPYSAAIGVISRLDDPERFRATNLMQTMQRRYGFGGPEKLYGYYSMLGEPILDALRPEEGDQTAFDQSWNFLMPFRAAYIPRSQHITEELVRLDVTRGAGELNRRRNGVLLTPQEYDSMNLALRDLVIPALDAVISGDIKNRDPLIEIFSKSPYDRYTAALKASKYIGAYGFVPDNRFSQTEWKGYSEAFTKEKIVYDLLTAARKKAADTTWETQVVPRLKEAGLTDKDIYDLSRGIKEEADFEALKP